jgi:hypothetical protein
MFENRMHLCSFFVVFMHFPPVIIKITARTTAVLSSVHAKKIRQKKKTGFEHIYPLCKPILTDISLFMHIYFWCFLILKPNPPQ